MPEISTGSESPSSPQQPQQLPVPAATHRTRTNRPSAGTARSGLPRIPPEVDGIQVNFCKNVACSNFGVVPKMTSKRGRNSGGHDTYLLEGGGGSSRGTPRLRLRCKVCGDSPPLKSNLAIAEEVRRLSAYLASELEPSCPNEACANHDSGVRSNPRAYQRYGTTTHGSTRYRCKVCRRTFAVRGPTTGQKKPHENREIFMELVNKAPFRRIMEKRDVSAATLYAKIDFLARQCERFVGEREARLLGKFSLGRLAISVDRQDYYTNWTRREDKRSVPLHAVVSADNESGYVFGAHTNFDPRFNPKDVEADVRSDDDDRRPQEYRRNARFWLESDYQVSVAASLNRHRHFGRAGVLDDAAAAYANVADRDDVEVADEFSNQLKLPESGMQVHGEYTLYAHFQMLNRLLHGASGVTFYLDQDSGIRAACFAAFRERIQAGAVHAFFVSIKKDFTKGQKLKAYNDSRRRFLEAKRRSGASSDHAVKIQLIKEQFPRMREIGRYHDRWLLHPLATMNEPEKALCHLTGRPDAPLDEDRLALMYLFGSMYGADRFLELIRRRISPLERALGSSSSARRMWYGYAPYNPRIIEKLLLLLRVYWNYCYVPKTGRDGKTPAERLGLAGGKVRVQDIIYFDQNAKN